MAMWLYLVEVQASQVPVHHWTIQRANSSPFFKTHLLEGPGVQVTLIKRKKKSRHIEK